MVAWQQTDPAPSAGYTPGDCSWGNAVYSRSSGRTWHLQRALVLIERYHGLLRALPALRLRRTHRAVTRRHPGGLRQPRPDFPQLLRQCQCSIKCGRVPSESLRNI